MDDYSVSSLSESKNEWCARLVNVLTSPIIDGLKSIFRESWELCISNDEEDKYLMTFQTFLSRIPKWNEEIISNEKKRIEDTSNCSYLEDLISCVHIIQLKALTCVRVGQKQKKIDIDIPNSESFIHKIYIILARKLYTSVYLFENNIAPLDMQKNNREIEILAKESIMQAIRDTMPIETILRAYMDETEEQNVDVEENIIETEITLPEETDKISTAVNMESTDNKENVELIVKSEPSETNPIIEVTKDTTPIINVKSETTPTSLTQPSGSDEEGGVVEHAIIRKNAASFTSPSPSVNTIVSPSAASLAFSDIDNAIDTNGKETTINAPKTHERLEKIATDANERRKQEEDEEYDDDQLLIGDEINLELGDINDLNMPVSINPPVLNDIEILH
jgi:hypothetical protein